MSNLKEIGKGISNFLKLFMDEYISTIFALTGKDNKIELIKDEEITFLSNIIPPIIIVEMESIDLISGKIIIAYTPDNVIKISDLMLERTNKNQSKVSSIDIDAIKEVSNNVFGAIANSMYSPDRPKYRVSDVKFLSDSSEYSLENYSKLYGFSCNDSKKVELLLIFDEVALDKLSNRKNNKSSFDKIDSVKYPFTYIANTNINLLSKTFLNVRARIGKKYLPLSVVKKLDSNDSIILEETSIEPLDILIQNQIIAKGEPIIVDGNFGIQITDIYRTPIEDKAFYKYNTTDKLDPVVLLEVILGDIDIKVQEILKFTDGSIIDFGIPSGDLSKLYVDKTYMGDVEVKVFENNMGVSLIALNNRKSKNSILPVLTNEDKLDFNTRYFSDKTIVDTELCKSGFDFLNHLSVDMLYTMLSNEHPQIIAITLLNIQDNDLIMKFLLKLDKELSNEVIVRIAKTTYVSNESLMIVSSILKSSFETKVSKSDFDGLDKVAKVLTLFSDEQSDQILGKISEIDKDLSSVIEGGIKK